MQLRSELNEAVDDNERTSATSPNPSLRENQDNANIDTNGEDAPPPPANSVDGAPKTAAAEVPVPQAAPTVTPTRRTPKQVPSFQITTMPSSTTTFDEQRDFMNKAEDVLDVPAEDFPGFAEVRQALLLHVEVTENGKKVAKLRYVFKLIQRQRTACDLPLDYGLYPKRIG